MRLRGVRDTGRGAKADAGEVVEIDAWVKANRTAGAVGGVVSAAVRDRFHFCNRPQRAHGRTALRGRFAGFGESLVVLTLVFICLFVVSRIVPEL